MGDTTIEWTQKTWNPVTGCTKVSQGCKNCYAKKFYERFNGNGSFENVICHADRLSIPYKVKKPAMWFVNSMSDLFHESVSFEFIHKVFIVMAACPWHTFQVLTKRPERMREYFAKYRFGIGDRTVDMWPFFNELTGGVRLTGFRDDRPLQNVWLGVSVENQASADERIPYLLDTPAIVRWISAEPLIGRLRLKTYFATGKIHWVVVGGESGVKARVMELEWIVSLCGQCNYMSIPFFFKQWGAWGWAGVNRVKMGKKKAGRELMGGTYNEMPKGFVWEK